MSAASSSSSWASARPTPDALVDGARQRLAALPQHDRLRRRDRAACAVLGLARVYFARSPRAQPAAVRSACTSAESPRGSAFSARRHRPVARPARADRRVVARLGSAACGPVDYLERLGLLNDRPHRCPRRRSSETPSSRRLGGVRRNRRDMSAQQPLDGRRRAADPPVLRIRRPRGDRHRQPGERRGSQPLQRDGRSATAGARRSGAQILRSATLDGATALGFGTRAGLDFGREARRAHRRPRPGRCRGCGRIPWWGESSRRTSRGWIRAEGSGWTFCET